MSRRARILFYCKLPRIGIYSIRLTPWIMSEPFRIWFRHVRNNLFAGTGKTLHCKPDSAYRHLVELHRMVRNGYSVSIRWVVKTVQCSLPMWYYSVSTDVYKSIMLAVAYIWGLNQLDKMPPGIFCSCQYASASCSHQRGMLGEIESDWIFK